MSHPSFGLRKNCEAVNVSVGGSGRLASNKSIDKNLYSHHRVYVLCMTGSFRADEICYVCCVCVHITALCGGYNYGSTAIRRPFDD